MLSVENIHTYYGKSHILNGVSLELKEYFFVALSGRNGVGKTTTLNSIIGFAPPKEGKIKFYDTNITFLPPHKISRLGITLVPQGRRIFPSLTVRENLLIAAFKNKRNLKLSLLEEVFSLFPALKERSRHQAKTLSGGEMQMLAIARSLMTKPKLLLMDEPTEGLAPLLVQEIKKVLLKIKSERQASVLLVEQNIPLIAEITDYVYIMNKGEIVYQSIPQDLIKNEDVKLKYLGVGK